MRFYLFILLALPLSAAEPLPLSESYWQDPSFRKSFNGSYRIEARIEPTVSTEERGLLVKVSDLMAQGQRTNSIELLEKSDLLEDSAALQFNLANLHFEAGELEKALTHYQTALKIYPSFRRAHANLAMALVRNGEEEKALDPLLEAIRLGDSQGSTYGLLGYLRLQRGEWASALQAYRLAQLTEPEVADWKAGTAQALQETGNPREAAALLDEVIRARPSEAAYAILQANLFLGLDEPAKALTALELPRRLGTLPARGLLLLTELHLNRSETTEARARLTEALALETPPAPADLARLAAGTLNQDQFEFTSFILENLEASPTRNLLEGRLLILSNEDPEKGAGLLTEFLKTDPTHGPALLALATYHRQKDDLSRAHLFLKRATLDGTVALQAWIDLTRLEVARERYPEALAALDQALLLQPDTSLQTYREGLLRFVEGED